jgi:hypothetical protein
MDMAIYSLITIVLYEEEIEEGMKEKEDGWSSWFISIKQ